MKCKIVIKTPKGQAKGTAKKLKPFILGLRKLKVQSQTNKDDNEIIWNVEAQIRDIKRITRNVTMFDTIIKNIFQHKIMKRYIFRKASKEQLQELKEMLTDQTTIEVIETSF